MAIPGIYTDFVQLADASTTTGWDDFGGNLGKWTVETDIYIEGAASISLPPKTIAYSGNGFGPTTAFALGGGTYGMAWVWIIANGYVSGTSIGGVRARMGSGATPLNSNYVEVTVGGSDAGWVGRGWHLVVMDPDYRPYSASSGAYVSGSTTGFGIGFDVTTTTARSPAMAIDAVSYGSVYALAGSPSSSITDATSFNFDSGSGTITRTAGSWITRGFEIGDRIAVENSENSGENDGEYTLSNVTTTVLTLNEVLPATNAADTTAEIYAFVTLEDMVAADITPWGAIVQNPVGGYDINFPFTIGDPTGNGGKVYFLSQGDQIRLTDQPIDGGNKITTIESASGRTVCRFGLSTGTGDNKVGFAGPIITQDNYVTGVSGSMDFTDPIADLEINGTVFLGLAGSIAFAPSGSHTIRNTSFVNCGMVDLSEANTRGVIFTGHDAQSASLYWDSASIDIKNSSFIANDYGIVVDAPGTITLYNLLFAGNTYDILNQSLGSVTASVQNNGTTPTYLDSGGGSDTLVIAEYALVLDSIVSGSEVSLIRVSDLVEIDHLENVDTDGLYTYTYNYTSDLPVYAYVHNIDYVWQSIPITLLALNQTLTVQQVFDRNYNNPA